MINSEESSGKNSTVRRTKEQGKRRRKIYRIQWRVEKINLFKLNKSLIDLNIS